MCIDAQKNVQRMGGGLILIQKLTNITTSEVVFGIADK